MPLTDVKPAPLPPNALVRIHFWRPGGADSLVCYASQALIHRRLLLAEGATIWHTETLY